MRVPVPSPTQSFESSSAACSFLHRCADTPWEGAEASLAHGGTTDISSPIELSAALGSRTPGPTPKADRLCGAPFAWRGEHQMLRPIRWSV